MIAVLRGGNDLTVKYVATSHRVEIFKDDYTSKNISTDAFDHLYLRLTDELAALKIDCVEYEIFDIDKPIAEYSSWFNEAWNTGDIYMHDGTFMMYHELGELAISPYSVVVRNFMGDLMVMEEERFERHYDMLEGIN